MKRWLTASSLALMAFCCPSKAAAQQFIIPAIVQQSTTITSAALTFSTNSLVGLSYMNCLQHVTVQSNAAAAQFIITTATITAGHALSPETTSYAVTLSSGVPYDTQWAPYAAWCGPPFTQVSLKVTNGGTYTISCEQFVTQGLAP